MFGIDKSSILKAGMGIGLNLASKLNRKNVAEFINKDQKNSIRLLYPNLDFGYSYSKDYHNFLQNFWDDEEF